MNSFDARVRYTRMIIEQSFLELLSEKPVSKITVTELCQKAQINRATFYKHYLDVQDLMERIEEELFQKIRIAFEGQNVELKGFLLNMLQYTRDEKDRYMALGGDNGDPNLMTKTFVVCYESAYPLLSQNIPGMKENERQMLYYFLSHGSGAVLTWWIRNGMRETPEEIVQFILNVCSITADAVQNEGWKIKYQQ